jgi:branched-subunit amino acid aminotransferase/4-amino-4-deoxychorismate lyase
VFLKNFHRFVKAWEKTGAAWGPAESVPISDRGFRYGMSFFESIAVLSGRPLFLDAHLKRFAQAAEDFGADCDPAGFDFSKLGMGLLRFYCTAGDGSPVDAFGGSLFALFEIAEVGGEFPAVRVDFSSAPYLPAPGGWKTGNYWQNTAALARARALGLDETLLFNPAGQLVGAAMANVFLRIDGRWTTPHLHTGARPGVVREWVLGRTGAEEEFLLAEDAARCDAAFLTNSRTGIRTISELDGRPLEPADESLRREYLDEICPA